METNSLEIRVRRLESGLWTVTWLCIALFLSLIGVIVSSTTGRVKAAEDAKVLRLKGLIIEDSEGRARIMLGSPIPEASERLRKDGGTDLVFLDEQGHDRFRVGEMLPAVPGFRRIGSSYGVTILDTQGGERGGMGFLSNGKNVNRAVIALDWPYNPSVSADAWGVIVDDATGLRVPATCTRLEKIMIRKLSELARSEKEQSSHLKTVTTRREPCLLLQTVHRPLNSTMKQVNRSETC